MSQLRSFSRVLTIIMFPLLGLSQQFFMNDGITLHFNIVGQGEPVVLLHGFTEDAHVAWRQEIGTHRSHNTLETLAEDFRVITMDSRGHGQSDKPVDRQLYGKRMVDDLAHLLDHLGIEQAHIVGYSMGAFIAGNFLQEYEDRVKSITMIGAAPTDSITYQEDLILQKVNLETVECLLSDCGINPLLDFMLPGDQPADLLNSISDELLVGQNRSALASCLLGFSDLVQIDMEKLKVSNKPIQLIMGEYDPLITLTKSYRQLPGVSFEMIKMATHIDIMSRPEMLVTLITFLKNLSMHSK